MSQITEAELLNAAKNRAWEVIRQWRSKPMCDDEMLAAMVVKVVLGEAFSVSEAWKAVADARRTGHEACITKDGRNLHDEGYCDVTGQDYNEWRG